MRRKRSQRWIAMLLAAAMLASTIESTGFAQTLHKETAEATPAQQEEKRKLELPERVKEWGEGYETIRTQEEADALRTADDSAKILVAAETCALAGLTFGELVSVDTATLNLSDLKGKLLCVEGNTAIDLYGTELEQLLIKAEKDETVTLHLDAETQIPEIILEGSGIVCIEGNGALGLVRAEDPLTQLTVRATCSVLNDSKESVKLVSTDGNTADLQPGEQKEIVLSSYLITFMADGQVYQTVEVKPGETIPFPEENPEKEGFTFTAWYKDETFTETCSQFAVARGQTTLYARFVDDSEAVQVTFDSMGGRELEPQILAKGETLLSRSINEIYTEKEGYTFGGWCIDEECTTAFSYTEPLEKDITLYAFFVSEEMQETTKDGNIASLNDFDWQDTIALRTDAEMTIKDVESNVQITAGTGERTPEVTVEETENGYLLRGSYYEKNGSYGFEPGATFTVILSGGIHFADYPDETDTAVVSVYKDQVEVVGFSEDMDYVLWDDVLEYVPVTMTEEEDTDADAEEESETDKAEAESEERESEIDELSDQDGDAAEEQEQAAYIPGTILVKDPADYEIGDLIAFYDGEIGRDEKSMDLYTEGSFDGYVLYAQILKIEKQKDGILLTYGYANPEDYLADFDVHISDDVNLENELNDTDVEVLTSRLSRQVEENEELKAQMLVSVMSAPETQDMLDEMYGEGVYALAAMTATLQPGKPTVKLSVSGSEVSAKISVSATATIKKDGKTMLTVKPTLAFTQSVGVTMNVDGGAVWIDMSVSVRSTSKIELTVTASTGRNTSVFSKAADTLAEIVKPEGIGEDDYESYDESVADLMDTMNSIVATSLKYNDLFDVLLLKLSYSFYGIITVSFEVHLVGQVGILATFGVEITATSGEKIGFKYNFLKFKGSSYTEKLESGVTSNIYLIGKVGARVGLRLVLSVTLCGIASASISGSVYAYAELTGLFFNTTNLLSGANTNLGALKFEVGIDVVVTLGLSVKLIIKTIRKNWTVYKGRWPLWSTSVSSKMSYMNGEKLDEMWAKSTANADNKTVFGFESIPMKTWDLMGGKCQENEQLYTKSGKFRLEIENLVVNGEAVPADDPKQALFTVGDPAKNQNPGYIYMDEAVAGEYICKDVALDIVLTYEDSASSALVKKQVKRFRLEKKCDIAVTTQKVNVVLYDWCARNWGIEAAVWDNAKVYETAFSSSFMIGGASERNNTGTLNQGEIISAAQLQYPELAGLQFDWGEPQADGFVSELQYCSPRISNFCYMTTNNGVVRYDVYSGTKEYEVTYYLYVRRFEGTENLINYHIRLNTFSESSQYEFAVTPKDGAEGQKFVKDTDGIYTLSLPRTDFNGTERSIMMSVNEMKAANTGFTVTGREYKKDVYFDMTLGNVQLNIASGEGVKGWKFVDPNIVLEEGIPSGTNVELEVELEEGYGGLEVQCENSNIVFETDQQTNKVRFAMPAMDLTITLRAYKKHSITYQYNYAGMNLYEKVYFTENETTQEIKQPEVEGMTFRGWYTSADCSSEPYTFGEVLTNDIILYADWTCDVTVVFGPVKGKALYTTGEDELAESHLVFEGDETEYYQFTYSVLRTGEKLWQIQTPEYEGYQFMDWYLDEACEKEIVNLQKYILSGGVTIYARWAKELSVVYDRNYIGQNEDETMTIAEVTGYKGYVLPFVPETPKREYYTFTGWYLNPASTELFDTEKELLTENIKLYAGWQPTVYEIQYELQGGTLAEGSPLTYTTEDTVILKEPTRTGYTFEGWTGTGLESLTKELTVQKGNGGERTYQANWKAIEYTITYEKTYDTAKENPIVYTIESTDIILEKPTREQYEFMGWIGTDLTEATQTVTIPTGSIGDRTYKATWETTDSIEKIFKWIEDLADTRPYQAELIDFLNTEDFSAETDEAMEQRRERLKESLEAKVKEYLIEEIAADEQLKSYKDAIQLEVAAVDKSLTSDEQRYVCEMKVLFTEDNGTEHNRTIQEYQAALTKIIPTLTLPTMNNLTYGQKVSESTVKTEGKAHYENKALQAELTVEGSFEWAEAEKTKVPYGMNNGTEKAQYTMVFTPADSENELFAAAEGKVGLLTQIGLIVSCTADSRDYDPDSAETTGTAGIWIAEEDRTAGDSVVTVEGLLKTGTYTFVNNVNQPDIVPEADKKVLYAGYELDNNKNTDEVYGSGVYVILNPDVVETKANLYKIGKDKVSISGLAATGTYEYSTLLETVKFKSGDVSYGQRKIDGTWAWNSPQTKLTVITTDSEVQKGTICFTPNDVVGYESFTEDIAITVTKKGIDVPAAVARTYTGEKQYSGLSDTDLYTVSDAGGTNAGPYTVTLTLKQVGGKDCYYWKSAEDITIDSQKGTAKVTYTIKPAEASVSGKAEEISIAYGQKLAVAGTEQIRDQMIYAKNAVTGLQVTFNNKPVTGSWEWDLTNMEVQPWNVDSSGYTVLIKFASSDKNIVVTTEKEMKVKVVSVTPDCSVKADTIYQFSSTDAPYQLSCSTLTQSLPTNPYTGEKIKGSWAWKSDQLTKTPVKDSNGNNPQYTCVFTYNSEADKTNYVELNRVIEVPVKYASESPVSYTVKIGAVTCQEGNEQFTIPTVGGSVFYNEGTSTSISKRIDSAPTTTSGQTNNQQMYFILNAGYCINAIEIKASKVSANGVTNKYGLGTENKGYTWSKAFSFPCDDTNYKISLYSEDTDLTFKKPTTYYIDIQGFVAWENIEITIAVDMRGPVMPYSLEDENMTMIENNVVAEVDTVVQPESQSEIQTDQSAAPSTESQTPPLQTEPVEEPTEPSTENQTAPPQTEPQTEVTEKPTEPSTENQTSPPQTEPQTEVTEKATEASTEGQTPPPQTETEPPATEPPVTEAVTEKQSETTVPQTAAQTSQSESAAPAEDSQNLPAETVPE